MRYDETFVPTKTIGGFTRDVDKSFRDELSHTLESVEAQLNLSPMDDIAKILKNTACKETYKERLLEGYMDDLGNDSYFATHAAKIDQLFENSSYEMLRESAITQLSPIVGLTLPVLKKSYAESVSKDIVLTEVSPQAVVKKQFERKFLKNKAGDKFYLPDMFYNGDWKRAMQDGQGAPVDDQERQLPLNDFNLLGESGGSIEKRDELGMDVHIASVKMKVKDNAGVNEQEIDVPIHLLGRVDGEHVAQLKVVGLHPTDQTRNEEYLTFIVDWYKGTVSVASTGPKITKVKFGGHLANYNNVQSVELDAERKTFTWNMTEGVRINTGIPIERIKDQKSMLDNDYISELVSDLSTVIAQMEDNDILDKLDASFTKWKGAKNLPLGYDLGFVEEKEFDCAPPAAGLLTTPEYLEKELSHAITKFVNGLKNKIKETDIMFVMHGHPECIDNALAGVDWIISDDTKLGGVALGYKFGVTTSGGATIHVVSSLKEDKAKGITLTAHSLNDNTFTFKNWKYSFNIENIYRNPFSPLIPNLMGTSRYCYAELQAVQGRIKLKNNTYGKMTNV